MTGNIFPKGIENLVPAMRQKLHDSGKTILAKYANDHTIKCLCMTSLGFKEFEFADAAGDIKITDPADWEMAKLEMPWLQDEEPRVIGHRNIKSWQPSAV